MRLTCNRFNSSHFSRFITHRDARFGECRQVRHEFPSRQRYFPRNVINQLQKPLQRKFHRFLYSRWIYHQHRCFKMPWRRTLFRKCPSSGCSTSTMVFKGSKWETSSNDSKSFLCRIISFSTLNDSKRTTLPLKRTQPL